MNSSELISSLQDKGLLDEETIAFLNSEIKNSLEKEIAYYKNIAYKKGLTFSG
tara:strand:+ start:6822 stop:6980 length:159 start_codon:yes stop_codon:yes gene_type:complete